jgi:hypothetical protein
MAMKQNAKIFVVGAIMLAAVYGVMYGIGQQILRTGANDPQVQLVQDAATKLNHGAAVSAVVPSGSFDVANSLAPFIMVYDNKGSIVASSATLDGRTLVLPSSVLAVAHRKPGDWFTWQPQPGVRIAAVTQPYNGGIVLAGRSLKEVEQREDHIAELAAFAWVASLFLLGGALWAYARLGRYIEAK